jgi:DNA-binding NarL/FixJ family response regulator
LLSALFELVWGQRLAAQPRLQRRASGRQPLVLRNDTTRAILSLLAAELSDQAIGRRLDCSERTIQRHVLKLTEAVGAKTPLPGRTAHRPPQLDRSQPEITVGIGRRG